MTKGARIRLPDEVLDRWKFAAEASGLNLSDWLRARIDGGGDSTGPVVQTRKPTPRKALPRNRPFTQADPQLIWELARIGENVNQIARWANTYRSAADAIQVISHLMVIQSKLDVIRDVAMGRYGEGMVDE